MLCALYAYIFCDIINHDTCVVAMSHSFTVGVPAMHHHSQLRPSHHLVVLKASHSGFYTNVSV